MIHNTLFFGGNPEELIHTLKQELLGLPKYTQVSLIEQLTEIEDVIEVENHKKFTPKGLEGLICDTLLKQPAVIVITDLHEYMDLQIPQGLPVAATVCAGSKEEALNLLKQNNIDIPFTVFVECTSTYI